MGLGPSCYCQWSKGNKEICYGKGYPANVVDVVNGRQSSIVDDDKISKKGAFLGTALFEFSTLVGKSQYKLEFFDIGKRDSIFINSDNNDDEYKQRAMEIAKLKSKRKKEEVQVKSTKEKSEEENGNDDDAMKKEKTGSSTNVAILMTITNSGADALIHERNPTLLENFKAMHVNLISNSDENEQLELTFKSTQDGNSCQSLVVHGIGVGPKPEYICGQTREIMDTTLKDTLDSIRRDLLMAGLNDLEHKILFT